MVRKSFVLALVVTAAACTANITIPKVEVNPASPEEKQTCRDLCNKIAAGTCLDANGLASCNQACDSATSSGVSTFRDCTNASSTCAKSCVDDLKNKGTTPPPDASPPDTTVGDAGATTDTGSGTSAEVLACEVDCGNQIFMSCEASQAARNACHDHCRNKPLTDVNAFHSCMASLPTTNKCPSFYTCLTNFGIDAFSPN